MSLIALQGEWNALLDKRGYLFGVAKSIACMIFNDKTLHFHLHVVKLFSTVPFELLYYIFFNAQAEAIIKRIRVTCLRWDVVCGFGGYETGGSPHHNRHNHSGTDPMGGIHIWHIKQMNIRRKFSLTWTRFAIMVAFLTPEVGLEKALWTFGMTFAAGQLPILWTFNTLITSRSAACCTAQIAFGAGAAVTVIPAWTNRQNTFEMNK